MLNNYKTNSPDIKKKAINKHNEIIDAIVN